MCHKPFVQFAKHIYIVRGGVQIMRQVSTCDVIGGYVETVSACFWKWSNQSNSRQLISLFAVRYADALQTWQYACRETLIAQPLRERELCHTSTVSPAHQWHILNALLAMKYTQLYRDNYSIIILD